MLSQINHPNSEENLLKTDPEKLRRLRHTCAHILAMAVQKLFPETKVTIGPTTDTVFYYDFDLKAPFTPEELGQITNEMKRIIKANLPVIREEVNREQIRG
jgi:threonyl-tRNA synthetase